MTAPPILTDAAVEALLSRWPRWSGDRERLILATEFADFDQAVVFINRVFAIAREHDHHPELHNVYNRVTLEMTTHDSGGVTERDARFIEAVEAL